MDEQLYQMELDQMELDRRLYQMESNRLLQSPDRRLQTFQGFLQLPTDLEILRRPDVIILRRQPDLIIIGRGNADRRDRAATIELLIPQFLGGDP